VAEKQGPHHDQLDSDELQILEEQVNATLARTFQQPFPDRRCDAVLDVKQDPLPLVVSRALVTDGQMSSTEQVTMYDTGATCCLMDREAGMKLLRQLPRNSSAIVSTPSIKLTGAATRTNETQRIACVRGLRLLGEDGHDRALPPLYLVDLAHTSFDVLIGLDALTDWDAHIHCRRREVSFGDEPVRKIRTVQAGHRPPPRPRSEDELHLFDISVDINQIVKDGFDENMEYFMVEANHLEQLVHEPTRVFADGGNVETQPWFKGLPPEIQELCKKFPQVPGTKQDLPPFQDHERADFAMPIPVPPDRVSEIGNAASRHLAPSEREAFLKQVQWLIDQRYIEPSFASVASPCFFVRKRDANGKFTETRWVTDYRKLNLVTDGDAVAGPRVDDIIDQLAGNKFYTTMDFSSFFYQLPIRPEDRFLTTFRDPEGRLWQYRVAAMGLKNSPRAACRAVHEMFKNLAHVHTYVDDSVLATPGSRKEHLFELGQVFARCAAYGVQINIEKCSFLQKQFHFLGMIFSEDGRRPDPERTAAVLEMPYPRTLSKLRSWLGIANYYSEFLDHVAEVTAPLYRLLKDVSNAAKAAGKVRISGAPRSTAIKLTSEHRECFDNIKRLLTSPPLLVLPDFTKRFVLVTDASKQAIAATLCQEYLHNEKPYLLPVAFYSSHFTKEQAADAPYIIELSAFVAGLDKFRPYLMNHRDSSLRPLCLSDHRPLAHLRTKHQLTASDSRVVDKIAEFDYDFAYLEGRKMEKLPADWLSRPDSVGILYQTGDTRIHPSCDPCALVDRWRDEHPQALWFSTDTSIKGPVLTDQQSPSPQANNVTMETRGSEQQQVREVHIAAARTLELLQVSTQKFSDAYTRDDNLTNVLALLKTGHASHHVHQRYHWAGGGLLFLTDNDWQTARLVVPNEYVDRVISLYHGPVSAGHPGERSTYLAVRATHWFGGRMYERVQQHVKACLLCRAHRKIGPTARGLLQFRPRPSQPLDCVSVDVIGPLPDSIDVDDRVCSGVIAYLDTVSGATFLVPGVASPTAEYAATVYFQRIFPAWGLPRGFISDRGSPFVAAFTQALYQHLGVKWTVTSAYHQQANPVERKIQQVMTGIRIFANFEYNNWAPMIPLLTVALNNRPSRNGQAPNEVLLGFPVRSVPPSIRDTTLAHATAHTVAEARIVARAKAQDAVETSRRVQERTYNGTRNPRVFAIGDFVMIEHEVVSTSADKHRRQSKLAARRVGPFKVTEVLPHGRLRVDFGTSGIRAYPVINAMYASDPPIGYRAPEPMFENGEEVAIVTAIVASKGTKRNVRQWRTIFNDGTTKWLTAVAFVDDAGHVTAAMIEFELQRTGLVDTTNCTWQYPEGPPGTIQQQADGFHVYFTREGDTIVKMRNYIQKQFLSRYKAEDILRQNEFWMLANPRSCLPLSMKTQFRASTPLRLPQFQQ